MLRKPAPTTPDVPVSARGKPTQKVKPFRPGQRIGGVPHGGGGPENVGARNEQSANVTLRQSQPSWKNEFENDFISFAGPSTQPDVSGGGGFHTNNDLPANAFRQLGDLHGGRQ